MTDPAPAWNGPVSVGTCPDGHHYNIPDRGGETTTGFCPGCNRGRTFRYWRGPVVAV